MPFDCPRLRGIREHLTRAHFFFDLALEQSDETARYRLMLATLYSCRAITELMLEAAEKQEVRGLDGCDAKANRKTFEVQISQVLPYYYLVERIRIHDFHRFGVIPPNPDVREMMLGGPIKLKAQKGAAAIATSSHGRHQWVTGLSQIQLQRPLLNDDGKFLDDESSSFVTLDEILETFLAKAPQAISIFEDSMTAA